MWVGKLPFAFLPYIFPTHSFPIKNNSPCHAIAPSLLEPPKSAVALSKIERLPLNVLVKIAPHGAFVDRDERTVVWSTRCECKRKRCLQKWLGVFEEVR